MNQRHSLIVMGVAGCGKSSLGQAAAQALGLPLVEGDDFHSPASVAKMRAGIALSDEDRAGWLDALALQLQQHPGGVVLTCSALKRAYRDRLRTATQHLRFAHLALAHDEALARVAARPGHVFPPSLVDSQFRALESPAGEPGVLELDATRPLALLTLQVVAWMQTGTP